MSNNLLHPLITTPDNVMPKDTSLTLTVLLIFAIVIAIFIIIMVAWATRNSRNPICIIVKYFLIIGISVFSLYNYRLFTCENGVSRNYWGNENFIEAISFVSDIQKVEYYKKTIPTNKATYKIFIETSNANYIFDAVEEDINSLSILGVFSDNIKPKKITPIPFYVDIILIIAIMFIPTKLKKIKNPQNSLEETEKIDKIY